MAEDNFEVLSATEVEAISGSGDTETEPDYTPKIRKLCACGCREEVTGNRALKRGHVMGDGLSASTFSGNDILIFQTAFVALIGAITAAIENKTGFPRTEPEESEAIGQALGRIAARHIPKAILRKMKPGDAADIVLAGSTITAFFIRASTMPKKEEKPVANNGYVRDSGISGQATTQYQYKPPEQQAYQS